MREKEKETVRGMGHGLHVLDKPGPIPYSLGAGSLSIPLSIMGMVRNDQLLIA
jgi:hypothetical protein